jgi:hypothetical protein
MTLLIDGLVFIREIALTVILGGVEFSSWEQCISLTTGTLADGGGFRSSTSRTAATNSSAVGL